MSWDIVAKSIIGLRIQFLTKQSVFSILAFTPISRTDNMDPLIVEIHIFKKMLRAQKFSKKKVIKNNPCSPLQQF